MRLLPTIEETVAFGELADFQAIGILARIEDHRPAITVEVVGGFQFRSHVRELHADHGVRLRSAGNEMAFSRTSRSVLSLVKAIGRSIF